MPFERATVAFDPRWIRQDDPSGGHRGLIGGRDQSIDLDWGRRFSVANRKRDCAKSDERKSECHMENHIRHVYGHYALSLDAHRLQVTANIMDRSFKPPIADEADAGRRNADCGRRRLAAALKKYGINDVHGSIALGPKSTTDGSQ
jgi:hypothetical protein